MKEILLLLIFANCALGGCPPMSLKEPWVLHLVNKNLPFETKLALGFRRMDLPRHQGEIYRDKIVFRDYGTLKNFVLWMKKANPNKKLEFTYDRFKITKQFYVTLIQEQNDNGYTYGDGNFTQEYRKGIGYK
jgi:hypothetical protein